MEQTTVLGGGLAGLATARELLKHGWSVTVIEKDSQVGGLARTIRHRDFRFDLGGHRFHSDNPELLTWLRDLVGEDLLYVPRRSRIWLGSRFADYPLRFPGAIGIFSLWQSLRILASYVPAALRHFNPAPDVSFEDWVVRRFGRALYDIYFRPYTEKVWGLPCRELSADWAAQRISLPSLSETIRRAAFPGRDPPATIVSHFWYPRYGFGTIPERLAQDIEGRGGRILTDAMVTGVAPDADGFVVTYEQNGNTHHQRAQRVVSSIPVPELLRAMPAESGCHRLLETHPLRYRDHICIFLATNGTQVSPDSWTYFPQKELLFGRTHEPKNWSAEMVPPDHSSLVAEVFSSRDEPTWKEDDNILIDRVLEGLETIGFLERRRVTEALVFRVANAYPTYHLDYAENAQRIKRFLDQWPNLHLVGRTGSFRYLNADGVIEDALALAGWLTGKTSAYANVSQTYRVP